MSDVNGEERDEAGGLRGAWLAVVVVLAALELLWLRFNASPGEPLDGAPFRMAAQGDLLAYYLPMMQYVAERITSGELPLWNPRACSGIPLLATLQIGAFYPGNALALVLPIEHAISWTMFVECGLAGVFAAWLFRSWGHGDAAAALGGALYLFGCVFGQVLWPPIVSSLLWIPFLLLCVEHLARGTRFRWWCALVFGLALQILAGFPQYLVYGLYVVVPFALLRLFGEGLPARVALARAGAIFAAALLGVGVAAVQLLPSFELAAQSARRVALTATDLHYLTPWDPFQSTEVMRAALDPSPRFISFNLATGGGYLGIATLLLAALAVFAAPRAKRVWLWIALGAVALLLSDGLLGASAPLYRVYAELPVVGSFRTPERMRVVTFFCVIALAVRGFDSLRPENAARLRAPAIGVALALFVGMIALGHTGGVWRVVVATALVLALLARALDARQRRAASLGLIALVVIDVVVATGEYGYLRQIPIDLSNRYASTDRRTVLPAGFYEEQRDEVGLARIELYKYRPRIASAPSDGGYRLSCYEPLVPAQWASLERKLAAGHGMGATLYDLDFERYAALYDVAGVARILREPVEGEHLVELNEDALPRAYLVNRWRVVPQERAFEHLRAGDVDFHAEVLLEEDPGLAGVGFPWPEIAPAEIVSYEPERVVVEADVPSASVLVLSDTHYPGWRATVDGEPARILRANGLYRAVALDRGSHRVVFDYAPGSLRIGRTLSLGSIAGVAVVGALAALRARGRRRGAGGARGG